MFIVSLTGKNATDFSHYC